MKSRKLSAWGCALSLVVGASLVHRTYAQTRKLAPFTVAGMVTSTKGSPLAGATVQLNADFVYGRASTTTGSDGRYSFRDLLKATYRAQAWVTVPYGQGAVCQQLAMANPTDYNSFPVSSGAIRNFRWQLTGKVGFTDQYFGASIRIWDLEPATSYMANARAIEFTLTPTGPLVDGSPASVIVKQAMLDYPASDHGLDDVPLGTYRLKAVGIGKDGRRTPLNIKPLGIEDFRPEIDLVWDTDRRCGFVGDNGTKPFGVELSVRR